MTIEQYSYFFAIFWCKESVFKFCSPMKAWCVIAVQSFYKAQLHSMQVYFPCGGGGIKRTDFILVSKQFTQSNHSIKILWINGFQATTAYVKCSHVSQSRKKRMGREEENSLVNLVWIETYCEENQTSHEE